MDARTSVYPSAMSESTSLIPTAVAASGYGSKPAGALPKKDGRGSSRTRVAAGVASACALLGVVAMVARRVPMLALFCGLELFCTLITACANSVLLVIDHLQCSPRRAVAAPVAAAAAAASAGSPAVRWPGRWRRWLRSRGRHRATPRRAASPSCGR